MTRVGLQLGRRVAERADYRCEYCRSPQAVTAQPFHVDHILPRSRGGQTTADNLCYACPRCNLLKGDRVSGIDPYTEREVSLFNPRRDQWADHFRWSPTHLRLIGRTATGRATIATLQLNAEVLVHARKLWILLRLLD